MARDTPLGFPAHTLPYRCGEFTTLSTVSKDSRIAAVLFASITMTAEIKIRQRNRLRVWQSQTWGRFRSFARVESVF